MIGIKKYFVFSLILLAAWFSNCRNLEAQRFHFGLRRAPQKQQSVERNVYFRTSSNVNLTAVNIGTEKINLLDLFVGHDLLPFEIRRQQALSLASRLDSSVDSTEEGVPKLPFEAAKLPFFIGAHNNNQESAILHVRGNQITVFPRALLVNTLAARAVLEPNDVVISFEFSTSSFSENPSKEDSLAIAAHNRTDVVHKWFYENIISKRSSDLVDVTMTGVFMPPELVGLRSFGKKFSSSVFPGSDNNIPDSVVTTVAALLNNQDGDDSDLQIGSYFPAQKSEESDEQPVVVVVNRIVGLRHIRYVVPFQFAGTFSKKGQDYQKLFEVSDVEADNQAEDKGEIWRFSNFLNISLLDDDSVELTSLISIPLFSKFIK